MRFLKSKILWLQVLSITIIVVEALMKVEPEWYVYTSLADSVLTAILRIVQGQTVVVAGKSITL